MGRSSGWSPREERTLGFKEPGLSRRGRRDALSVCGSVDSAAARPVEETKSQPQPDPGPWYPSSPALRRAEIMDISHEGPPAGSPSGVCTR